MKKAEGNRTKPDGPGEDVDRWASAVIDAAMAVHRVLGPGFRESVYEEALCVEVTARGIPFERQVQFVVEYGGVQVGEGKIDLVVASCLILELKAVDQFAAVHVAQVLSYLKATGIRLGLLLNFKVALLKDGIRRVVL